MSTASCPSLRSQALLMIVIPSTTTLYRSALPKLLMLLVPSYRDLARSAAVRFGSSTLNNSLSLAVSWTTTRSKGK